MFAAADVHVSPVTGVLIMVSGISLIAFMGYWEFKLLFRRMSGWRHIAARFPMGQIHLLPVEYKRQTGSIGRSEYRTAFNIRLAHEGVCINPSFARRTPCLIPWSSIRQVDVSDRCIVLTVDYERPMQFFLPPDALQDVRTYVPPVRFRQAVSVFQTMRSAVRGGLKPRWLWRSRE